MKLAVLLFSSLLMQSCGSDSHDKGPQGPDHVDSKEDTRLIKPIPPPLPLPPDPNTQNANLNLPVYKSLTEVFPNVTEIMQSSDTATTLFKMRKIASPTQGYHKELVSLVEGVTTTDMAHIKLLLDAAYYPFVRYKQMYDGYNKLRTNPDAAQQALQLLTELRLASAFAESLSSIVNIGFKKASDFNWAKGIELLKLVYPIGQASEAFQKLITTQSSMTNEQEEELMLLASDKLEVEIAAEYAIKVFNRTDKSLNSLFAIVDKLKVSAKDRTMLKGLDSITSLTHEQVAQCITRESLKNGEIAVKAYKKSSQKSHANLMQIISSYDRQFVRDYIVQNTLDEYKTFTSSQAIDLCKASTSYCPQLAKVGTWQDPSVAVAVSIGQSLRYENKDIWLDGVLKYFNSVNTNEVFSLAKVAYANGLSVAMTLVKFITNLTTGGATYIAGLFHYDDKDSWLFAAEPYIKNLNGDELYQLVQAAYSKKRELAEKIYPKLSSKTVAEILKTAGLLHYDNKDEWLDFGLGTLSKFTSAEFYNAVYVSYNFRIQLARKYKNRISDLSINNLIKIASLFKYDEIDEWLKMSTAFFTSYTTAEVFKIIPQSYNEHLSLLLSLLPKITDLTVAHTVILTKLVTYDSRDTFLLAAIEKITDLDSGKIASLENLAYSKKEEVRKKALEKIGAGS